MKREVEKGIGHFKLKKSIRFDWEDEEAGWEMVNTQFLILCFRTHSFTYGV